MPDARALPRDVLAAAPAAVPTRVETIARGVAVPLFTATLFLSSFLMFAVEPMVARTVLPILGGVPMVWNGCMVFFQTLLLGGYGIAHGITRWCPPRWRAVVFAALVCAPLAFLNVNVGTGMAPGGTDAPLLWLLAALLVSVGAPFFLLSMSASILQDSLATTDHRAARDPYFLYIASNAGSLVALAAYPSVIEPYLGLKGQADVWMVAYGIFAALAVVCAVVAHVLPSAEQATGRVESVATVVDQAVPDWPRRARWFVLAFVPSSLLLGVTTYFSTDIAPIPLLWIVPLWVYLLTFVLAFSASGEKLTAAANRWLPMLLLAVAVMMITRTNGGLLMALALHVGTFFAAALMCHGRLAQARPSPRHLTEFYFWLSFGGMVGGLFNTLAAPMLFPRIVEYPLALGLAALLRSVSVAQQGRRVDVWLPVAAIGLAAWFVGAPAQQQPAPAMLAALAGVVALAAFWRRYRPVTFAVAVGALLVAAPWVGDRGELVLHAQRTFFGTYRVSANASGQYHALAHGTTLHGMEATTGAEVGEPLTYFHRTGPFGEVMAAVPRLAAPQEVAVVGLGVGTLAAYVKPGQRWTFFEIDPAIEGIARRRDHFTFMERCGAACRVQLGDARLSLKATNTQYGLLVLDAFSSDAIPVHLMTTEAMDVYLSHLAPNGVLVFHISNRHLELNSIVGRLAAAHGLTVLEQRQLPRVGEDWPAGKQPSHWVAMGRHPEDLGALTSSPQWSAPTVAPSTALWSDDYSNVLSILRLR